MTDSTSRFLVWRDLHDGEDFHLGIEKSWNGIKGKCSTIFRIATLHVDDLDTVLAKQFDRRACERVRSRLFWDLGPGETVEVFLNIDVAQEESYAKVV